LQLASLTRGLNCGESVVCAQSKKKISEKLSMVAPQTQSIFASKHGTKASVCLNPLAGARVFGRGFSMTERKANEESFAHLFLSVGHIL
jgi:hypothetical protein